MLPAGSRLTNNPIKKQPTMLTVKVETGNAVVVPFDSNTDVRKRKTLPTAPPNATHSICLIIGIENL